ncbi:MAG: hypothetical protein J6A67_09060 [Clostridia bacterium]|nr:hypothetical protein [Clostridia bacterium]
MSKIAVLNEFSIEAVRDALQKLDDFKKLIVNGLTAFELNELEKIDPVLFEAVAKQIKRERWYPSVGMWMYDDGDMSEEKLIRNVLYSTTYFKEKFDKEYRVFHGAKIYNDAFTQVIYTANFDACVLDSEKETYWLDNAAFTRTLVYSDLEKVDINDIDDEFIKANDFESIEDEVMAVFQNELDLGNVKQPVYTGEATEAEKLLLKAERICVQEGKKAQEEIQNCWISLFMGEDEVATDVAETIIGDAEINEDFIKINSDEVKVVSMKYAEDLSDDVVIRIKETAGKEKAITVMCDAIDAGFRAEILPYELQTFRVNAEGFVEETPISE